MLLQTSSSHSSRVSTPVSVNSSKSPKRQRRVSSSSTESPSDEDPDFDDLARDASNSVDSDESSTDEFTLSSHSKPVVAGVKRSIKAQPSNRKAKIRKPNTEDQDKTAAKSKVSARLMITKLKNAGLLEIYGCVLITKDTREMFERHAIPVCLDKWNSKMLIVMKRSFPSSRTQNTDLFYCHLP